MFVEDGDWYLLVHTTCKHLQPDNRCGIYYTRPQICRDYSTDNCEYEDDWVYERYFETPEQVEEYIEAVLPLKKGHSFRSRRPELLPIIGLNRAGIAVASFDEDGRNRSSRDPS